MNSTISISHCPRWMTLWFAASLCCAAGVACNPDYDLSGKAGADAGGLDDAGDTTDGSGTTGGATSTGNGTMGTTGATSTTTGGTTGDTGGTTGGTTGSTTGGTTGGTGMTGMTGGTTGGTTGSTNGTTGGCMPSEEVCDGEDNDCDDLIDEDCECEDGDTQPCGPDEGECVQGEQACEGGAWGECLGASGPQPEVCDGLDNDCNGTLDDETEELLAACEAPEGAMAVACEEGRCVFACAEGLVDVNDDLDLDGGDGCECEVSGEEVCDGVDNDCDGQVDEPGDALLSGCADVFGAEASCVEGACAYQCADGRADANEDLSANDSDGCECVISTEVCDAVDNDCDGEVDEPGDALLSSCGGVSGAEAQACEEGGCVYACVAERFDIDEDLARGVSGTGCECIAGQPGCDSCEFVPMCEPGTPSDYDYTSPGSHLTSIAMSFDGDEGADLDGDGQPNNTLGPLISSLFELTGNNVNINRIIELGVNSNQIAIGMMWPTLDGAPQNATDVTIDLFDLVRTAPQTWVVTEESFLPDSQTPRRRFMDATITDGRVRATGGTFQLAVPEDTFPLSLSLSDVEMEADVSEDMAGIVLSNGYIAGGLPVQEFFNTFNSFLASDACSCLDLDGPFFDLSQGINSDACTQSPDTSQCRGEVGGACAALVNGCPFLVPIFGGQADLDLDGDGFEDAYSAYLIISAEGARITGVQP